jgi:hypothetical protein
MEYVWSKEIDSVLSVGRHLENIGVRNWALGRDAALTALEQLRTLGVPVLGGDVYTVRGDDVELSYDSWYCNQDGKADREFVEQSIAKASNYIGNYRSTSGEVLFAIVPMSEKS